MIRWVGLGLAILGGFIGVIAAFGSHLELAVIGVMLFVIGIFALSRPNI